MRKKIVLILLACGAGIALFAAGSHAQRRTFSHTTAAHRTGKFASCTSCHVLPTKNWTSARPDKDKPYPDTRNFPSHASCFGCHTKDIYSNGGAFCGTCHTVPTMRARALLSFPIKSHARQFDIIFPHDKHQELIAENTVRETPYATAHFVNASFLVDDKSKPTFYNCAICHETRTVLPKFGTRKIVDVKSASDTPLPDTFTKPIVASFFKDSPDSHASCFQCHYKFQNLPPGKNNCSGCHVSAAPYFEGKTLERYSLKFDHDRAGHVEKDCAFCHVRIAQNADVRTLKDADVPIASCKGCHATQENDPAKSVLRTEVAARESSIAEKKPAFQCTYCHTAAIGRFDTPASHKFP